MMLRLFSTLVLITALSSTAFSQRDTTVVGKQRSGAILVNKDTTLAAIPTNGAVLDSVPVAAIDSLTKPDSTIRRQPGIVRFFTKNYPDPRKAALFALLLPGAGQAYNRRWWKIPIVYGVLGGIGYVEYNHIQTFKLYRDSYKALVDDDPTTVVEDPKLQRQDRTTLKANRDIARRNLEQSSLILGLGYILSITDAFVDAHLSTFDVSDDLSLNICPKATSTPGFGANFGVGIQLAF